MAYLLKPVEPERLAQAVERARKLSAVSDDREHVLRVVRESPRILRQIVCRKRDRVVLMPPEQILWFQVEDGLVRAHTGPETFWVNYQLGELEASLPEDLFFRARREVLVNLTRIKEIKPYFKSGFLLGDVRHDSNRNRGQRTPGALVAAENPRIVASGGEGFQCI
jgi:DNA-binding LytR/AlgR family response regulator